MLALQLIWWEVMCIIFEFLGDQSPLQRVTGQVQRVEVGEKGAKAVEQIDLKQ